MKKILLLADAGSSHTQKWAEAIKEIGYDVMIFSFTKPSDDRYAKLNIGLAGDQELIRDSQFSKSDFQKASYIRHLRALKKTIRTFQPDLIHAHYATSYGLLGALCNFKPYIISVWGSDVFDFPKRSFVHKAILKFNLAKAACVISSSKIMAEEAAKYYRGKIEIIPFGINLSVFRKNVERNDVITIGLIKTMEDHYGIQNLIRAFHKVKQKYAQQKLKLLLIGGGTQIEKYKQLVSELRLSNVVEFRGKISQQMVPAAHHEIDVFVNPSVHESFGVSVLEASASGNPVIVTDVGGLKEVVVNHSTGLIVEQGNDEQLADAIGYFVENQEQINIFGENGRNFVSAKYDLKKVYDNISDLYRSLLNKYI